MRLVLLDSGPLGLLTNARGKPDPDRCRQWVIDLAAAGTRIYVPEIADYEVRRKLTHIGATAGLRRLDQVNAKLKYAALTTAVMRKASEVWAQARQRGRPTAAPQSLDGDCILIAQALLAGNPGDVVIVATANVGHLGRFVDARLWDQIAP